VVEPYPSENYEFVNGKDDIPYIKHDKTCFEKIDDMFIIPDINHFYPIYDMDNKIHV